jgi:hypothetical protein
MLRSSKIQSTSYDIRDDFLDTYTQRNRMKVIEKGMVVYLFYSGVEIPHNMSLFY